MMKKIILLLIVLVLPLMSFAQEQPIQHSDTNSPLMLTIKADKEVYEIGDEVILLGYFRNISSKPVYIIKDKTPLLWCRLIIITPIGNEFWYDAYPTEEFGPAPADAYTAVLPNQSIEYFIFKTRAGELAGHDTNWYCQSPIGGIPDYPFIMRGQYKIKFQYINLTPTRKDALEGAFTSNTITIEVKDKK